MKEQIEQIIQSEEDYKKIQSELGRKKKPAKILKLLMNALESYRQSKKYGWSRPWNKYDLVNFQSFMLRPETDEHLVTAMQQILRQQFPGMAQDAQDFCDELLANREQLMGFIFYHEFHDNGIDYEGVTLSFGRVNAKRFRDRLDLILESPIDQGKSMGLNRARLFVDPYREGVREPLYQEITTALQPVSRELFDLLCGYSWDWANDENRLWDHWTSHYIDYFGDRKLDLDTSYFYTGVEKTSRISQH
ncbi:MAG: hypothetical protein OEY56_08405 [Cyclobacteriaceae bacterium]|nr:hypothetical protein [Cyclobacteriaceae bacterium]